MGRVSWEWFCTWTFRDNIAPEAAEKRYRTLVSKVNRHAYGNRWFAQGRGVQWVNALERQRRGVLHFHSLWRGVKWMDGTPRALGRFDVMKLWEMLNGFERRDDGRLIPKGIARVFNVRSTEAVKRYCAKYVVKGGEIDVGGPGWSLDTTRRLVNTTEGDHDRLEVA